MGKEDERIEELWEDYIKQIKSFIEGHGLNAVDLVIEGGVGNGTLMREIVKEVWPQALYLGTDISPALMAGKPRLKGQLTEQALEQITNPAKAEDQILYANCFDGELIRDIMNKTGRQIPILVSLDALYSLLARDLNLWEHKRGDDMVTVKQMLSPNTPYVAQFHLGVVWKDEGRTSLSGSYFILEREAQRLGWEVARFVSNEFPSGSGLLIKKK